MFIWERRSGSSVAGVLLAAEEGTLTGVEGCCDIVGSSLSSCSFALAATEWASRLGNRFCIMPSLEERGVRRRVAVGEAEVCGVALDIALSTTEYGSVNRCGLPWP